MKGVEVKMTYHVDSDMNPMGGDADLGQEGEGVLDERDFYCGPIRFQDGVHGGDTSKRNGWELEELLEACLMRLAFFQKSKFKCDENADAAECIVNAIVHLNARTAKRTAQGIEGTMKTGESSN